MKMAVIVCPKSRHQEFRKKVDEAGFHAFTEIRHAVGEGVTGKKFGSLIWPGESVVFFLVIESEKVEEIVQLVEHYQKTLYPSEGMRAFIVPVEKFL